MTNETTPKKKGSIIKKILIVVIILVVIVAIFGNSKNDETKKEATPEIQYPQDQTTLIEASKTAMDKAIKADNDMQKGSALRERSKAICNGITNLSVKDWVGTIKKIDSNSDGYGVLEIEIARKIYVKTWNNALSDSFHKTLLKPDTPLFDKIANMKKGQKVKFSGNFFKDNETCIYESSLSLDGKLTEPEYIFRFSDVNPL
ncbi:hypothetical protein [Gilliamella apis]|uniref:hypothetical protein n=1 Tax=Gilliamella apis TaxID=1970738 RepID=UPI000A34601A|nr:hypothetical protein [Gilliamella apis]OTQ62040.1 hypothetical protein B6C98_03160 [Gilliamella apis]OTQ63587.1 hypothetical protein B6D09_09705 [Gilliamella apis]OTQ67338.1 hypothetical protein B6C89_05275 [Gilliamella apis]OTQ67664.1 hypothetical protein B6D10_08315 [Gilliamella apis]